MKYSIILICSFIVFTMISSCKKDDDSPVDNPIDPTPIAVEIGEDYEALKAFYEANANNTLNWDLDDKTLKSWEGLTIENDRVTEIRIPAKNIQRFTVSIFTISELKTLGFADNEIKGIPPQIENLTRLEVLNLENNQLENLVEEIKNITSLKLLNLKGNQLRELPYDMDELTALTTLNIEDNLLIKIPYEICILEENGTNVSKNPRTTCDLVNYHYRGLKALYEVNPNNILTWDLTDTNMASWSDVVLTSEGTIEELDLQSKGLSIIPEQFGNLIGLKYLNLTSNGITQLPNEFTRLTSLTILDIEENGLSSLPNDFGRLNNIEELDLSENLLSSLPESLGAISALETIDLDENLLKKLPESIINLTNLRRLEASDNALEIIPVSIGDLQNLEDLDLENNNIELIPQSIKDLQNVTFINVENNNISMLPQEIVQIPNILRFSFSGNPLQNPLTTELCDLHIQGILELDIDQIATSGCPTP